MSKKSRWVWFAAFTVLIAGLTLLLHSTNPSALRDSDTQKILAGLTQHPQTWIWWHHDWPLDNHFYRPLTTALFQLDYALHPLSPQGWLWTNAILACGVILALGWFLRELTDSIPLSSGALAIFLVWTADDGWRFTSLFLGVAAIIFVAGFFRHGFKVKYYLPAALVWVWIGTELAGITTLHFAVFGWIPGRTASLMTLLALISMASFSRVCRLSPKLPHSDPEPSSLDRPASKNDSAGQTKPAHPVWLFISLAACGLALASYEQAIVIPALLALAALSWQFRGRRVPWIWAWPFAVLLGLYLAVHLTYVPRFESTYYQWQKRTWTSSLFFLQRYLFFPLAPLTAAWFWITSSPVVWVTIGPWASALEAAAALTALWQARRKWILCGFGWLGSALAYLPMTFYKDFDHYHYLPMAIRSLFAAGLIWVALDLTVTAVSPPAIQAPARLHPAPGSLPHP